MARKQSRLELPAICVFAAHEAALNNRSHANGGLAPQSRRARRPLRRPR